MIVRTLVVLACLSVTIVAQAGQRRITNGLVDRVQATATTNPRIVAPGDTVTLKLEVTPDHGIRVYAPGAKSFTGAFVLLAPSKQFKVTKPVYGIPEVEKSPGNNKRVPLYTSAFNIDYAITIDKDAAPGTEFRILGALRYQTCDDRVVFPPRTLPVSWTVRVAASAE